MPEREPINLSLTAETDMDPDQATFESRDDVPPVLPSLPGANQVEYLVTDADNNLWDWVSMHAKCMHQMAARLCSITGIPYDRLAESMKRVYKAAKTLDYSNLVESMDIVQHYASVEAESLMLSDAEQTERARAIMQSHTVANLAMSAKKEYDIHRNKEFKLYPNIKDVFEQAVATNRIKIVILTDAPYHKTVQRLLRFQLEQYIHKMFGQVQKPLRFDGADDQVEFGPGQENLRPYYEAIRSVMPNLEDYSGLALKNSGVLKVPFDVVVLDEGERKPRVDLARRLRISPKEVNQKVVVWGDNAKSDGGVAAGIDVNEEEKVHNSEAAGYLYSEYGQTSDDEVATLLTKFGSTQEVSRNLSYGESVLDKLRALQDRFIGEQIQQRRTEIAKVIHPIQVLDKLGIPRP